MRQNNMPAEQDLRLRVGVRLLLLVLIFLEKCKNSCWNGVIITCLDIVDGEEIGGDERGVLAFEIYRLFDDDRPACQKI